MAEQADIVGWLSKLQCPPLGQFHLEHRHWPGCIFPRTSRGSRQQKPSTSSGFRWSISNSDSHLFLSVSETNQALKDPSLKLYSPSADQKSSVSLALRTLCSELPTENLLTRSSRVPGTMKSTSVLSQTPGKGGGLSRR